MNLIGRILWIQLNENCRRENHFDLDCVKNKNRISTNKKSKLNKVYYFSFKNYLDFR